MELKHWLSNKENIMSAVVSNEGDADSVLGQERARFPLKKK